MTSTLAQSLCMDMELVSGKQAAVALAESLYERGVIGDTTYAHILSILK